MGAIGAVPGAVGRRGLNDAEWARLRPLLPDRPRTGRPAKAHRLILDALLWPARTGAPWRDLPDRYGPWRSVATRFYRWTKAGVWECVLSALRRLRDLGRGTAERWLDDNLAAVGTRPTLDLARFARPAVEIQVEG